MRPYVAASLVTIPILCVALLAPSSFYDYLRRPKNIDFYTFLLGLSAVFVLCASAYLTSKISFSRYSASYGANVAESLKPLSACYAAIVLFAYILYLGYLLLHPAYVITVLSGTPGSVYVARAASNKLAGLTSFTQLGIAWALLYIYRSSFKDKAALYPWDLYFFYFLLALSIFRAFALGERLALIEVAIPCLVLYARFTRTHHALVRIAPVFALALFVIVFTISEWTRSWVSHYSEIETDFSRFVILRILGYYVAAIDTAAGFYNYVPHNYSAYNTARWLWDFPIDFGQRDVLSTMGLSEQQFSSFLYNRGNPEFNNLSGIFVPFIDFGFVGGILVWLFIGCFVGCTFNLFARGSLFGCTMYPLLLLFMIELPRVFAFGGTRYFIPQVSIIFAVFWVRIAPRRNVVTRLHRSR